MLGKRAIEPVSSHNPNGRLLHLDFPGSEVRRMETGDQSVQTESIHLISSLKMETVDSVPLMLQRNDWAVTVDLKYAYFNIAVHPKSRMYLHCHFMGRTYQFQALLFRLSPAPSVFTRVVKTVVKHCRQQGMRLHAYLNEWPLPSVSLSLPCQQRD